MTTVTDKHPVTAGALVLLCLAGCSDRPGVDGNGKPPWCPDATGDTPDAAFGQPDVAGESSPEPLAGGEAGPRDGTLDDAPGLEVAPEPPVPVDGATPAPMACAIVATLEASAGSTASSLGAALPASHRFTLLVDWAAGTATTGSGGTSNKVSLLRNGGEWTTQGALVLSLAVAPNWPKDGTTSVGRPYVSYQRIDIHPTEDGCAGQATGRFLGANSDVLFDLPFEATLAGVVDRTGPDLVTLPSNQAIHPLDLQAVVAGELLPVGTTAGWVSSDGSTMPMTPLPPDGALGVSGFLAGSRALAFASSYRLDVLPAVVDLAGNLTAQPPVLTTLAGPGFFAQDGFEGTVDALLGGKVSAVDGTALLPIPAGKKAVRFAPIGLSTRGDSSCDDRFTARLAVTPTAKSVKVSTLSYRSSFSGPFMGRPRVAVPNGAVSDFGMYGMVAKGTALPNPWSGALPGSDVNTYGQLTELEFALPPGTAGEVIFDIDRPCTEPMLPGDGLIIDDLRVE